MTQRMCGGVNLMYLRIAAIISATASLAFVILDTARITENNPYSPPDSRSSNRGKNLAAATDVDAV